MEKIQIDGFAHAFPDLAANAEGIAFSKSGARAYFVTIGPEMAKRLLEYNKENYRKPRPKHVDFLSKQMSANEFLMNGDPIRVDTRHTISDGQHRLMALANQDDLKQIEFLIVDHLAPETTPTINANALSRSYIDHLRRKGYQNPTSRCAVTILYYKWENDRPLDSSFATSIQQLDSVAAPIENQLSWAVSNAGRYRRIKGIQPALVTLSFLILGEISELAVKQLFIGVAEGENIHRGMPAYTLRSRLFTDYENKIKRLKSEQLWFVFRAFDVERKNLKRNSTDQLTIDRLLPLPQEGVSTRDLKNMLATE